MEASGGQWRRVEGSGGQWRAVEEFRRVEATVTSLFCRQKERPVVDMSTDANSTAHVRHRHKAPAQGTGTRHRHKAPAQGTGAWQSRMEVRRVDQPTNKILEHARGTRHNACCFLLAAKYIFAHWPPAFTVPFVLLPNTRPKTAGTQVTRDG